MTRSVSVMARLRSSLWLAPTIALLTALATSVALIEVDLTMPSASRSWFFFGGSPESAQRLLSTIASAMLQFTALVFSVTVLALQLASNQLSPRVIRAFLEERITKWALAVFVGTFAYSMMVLSQVRTAPQRFVPAVATWIAFVLVMASIGVFIAYIHRMAHSIRAITVISKIASETRVVVERMYPRMGAPVSDEQAPVSERAPDMIVAHEGPPGTIARVNTDALFEMACAADAVIEIVPRVGDFVSRGEPMFRVWGGEHLAIDAARAAVELDIERTIDQDPAFGFRELVDIALRALSTGVNDPTTAVQALDHLHDLLRRITVGEFPSRVRADERGAPRLVADRPDYEDLVALACDELVHYGAGAPQVVRRLRAALIDCAAIAVPARRAVLEARLRDLERAAATA